MANYKEPAWLEERDARIVAAFKEHGLLSPTGQRLWAKVRQSIVFQAVHQPGAIVDDADERKDYVLTKGRVTKGIFTNTPDNDDAHNTDDPEMTRSVWKALTTATWSEANDDPSGEVQKLIAIEKPGYVLCRTKVSADGTDAIYITRDRRCLLLDMVGPRVTDRLEKEALRDAAFIKMLAERVPEHVDYLEADFESAMRGALESGRNKLRPALTAARDAGYGSSNGAGASGSTPEGSDE